MSDATAKTLLQAIENGMRDALKEVDTKPIEKIEAIIQHHVLDFLRQSFGTSYLDHASDTKTVAALQDLYKAIATVEISKPIEQKEFEEWHA